VMFPKRVQVPAVCQPEQEIETWDNLIDEPIHMNLPSLCLMIW